MFNVLSIISSQPQSIEVVVSDVFNLYLGMNIEPFSVVSSTIFSPTDSGRVLSAAAAKHQPARCWRSRTRDLGELGGSASRRSGTCLEVPALECQGWWPPFGFQRTPYSSERGETTTAFLLKQCFSHFHRAPTTLFRT